MPIPSRDVNIRFAVAGRAETVDPAHPIWAEALPVAVRRTPSVAAPTATITHGDYFQAIHTYLLDAGIQHIQAALKRTPPTASSRPASLQPIDVILEKHGEFYHPARIRVAGPQGPHDFALNVAVTPVGIECMDNEVRALRKVTPRLPKGVLPCVYGEGDAETKEGLGFRLFLADWFENHFEFHLSIDPRDGAQKIIVWDNRLSPYYLPRQFLTLVYFEAAYLLTRAYNLETTHQIYPWHHASGDFVLRHAADGVGLKLITVRQYAPTIGGGSDQPRDEESRLMAAMVFFANLTLRNRIDRLDGTGELAWAEDAAVAATVAGFKRAMAGSLPLDLENMLRGYDTNDWIDLLTAIASRYRLMPAEEAFMVCRVADHAACLQAAIRGIYDG